MLVAADAARPARGTDDFKAAEVCPEQNAPLSSRNHLVDDLRAMDTHVEPEELVVQQEDPVEEDGCKGVVMTE